MKVRVIEPNRQLAVDVKLFHSKMAEIFVGAFHDQEYKTLAFWDKLTQVMKTKGSQYSLVRNGNIIWVVDFDFSREVCKLCELSDD